MKRTILLSACLLLLLSAHTQFTSDTLNPLGICTAANIQKSVKALKDNNGGYFVFWRDNRTTTSVYQVFAQHLNSQGVPYWPADGKLVYSASKNISAFVAEKWQSGFLLAWLQTATGNTGDSLFCQYIDTNGAAVWPKPTLIANIQNNITSINNVAFGAFVNDSGITITHSYSVVGGGGAITFNRLDTAGNLRWPILSKAFPLNGIDYRSVSDGYNGFYALSKSTGQGSTMFIQRFNLQGEQQWVSGLDITSGVSANGYTGNINMNTDADTNLYIIWDAYGGSIDVAKVTPNGNFGWADERLLLSDSVSYIPRQCDSKIINDTLYVGWQERRNKGIGSIVLQKLDRAGKMLLSKGGLVVGAGDQNSDNLRLASGDGNCLVSTYFGVTSNELLVQRVRPDGSLTWGGNGKVLCSLFQKSLASNDYNLLDSPSGCNAVFWTSGNNNIYGTEICSDAVVTSVSNEQNTNNFPLIMFPNPASSNVYIDNSAGSWSRVSVYDVTGRLIQNIQPTSLELVRISTFGWAKGMYFVRCCSAETTVSKTLVVE